jgi:hypothetical protein
MSKRLWGPVGRFGVLALCVVAALAAASSGSAAASVNVPCGNAAALVAAVNTVNTAGGGSINLASGCTYSLTTRDNTAFGGNGLPVVVTPITVNGKGATIAGNSTNFRIVAVDGTSGGALTLNGVTITGGKVLGPMAAGAGGGILDIAATLTLNSAVVTSNFAASAGGGIGDAQGAVVTLNKSEVSWNTVPVGTGAGGGGIISMAATLTLNDSVVDHNFAPGGGGIASGNGMGGGPESSITLNKSVISDNRVAGAPQSGGGGISNGGTLVSNNSQIIDNTAVGETGAGLLNHVTATLNKTVVSGNTATDGGFGGGIVNAIFFAGQPTPTLVINNGQVTGNSADGGGGGIVNISFDPTVLAGTVTLNHTDVSGNNPDNCEPPGAVPGCVG